MNISNIENRRHGCTRRHDTAQSVLVVVESAYGPLALTADALREASSLARTFDPRIGEQESSHEGAPAMPTNLIDAAEAARQLGVKPTWLLTRAREGRLPHVRVGKFVRFDIDELRRLLDRGQSDMTT